MLRHPNVISLLAVLVSFAGLQRLAAAEVTLSVKTPMSPPAWALLERELLRANAAACEEFFERYFDERGWLLCVERWGGDDGPDDAIENCNDWPLLHALGASDDVLQHVQEGLGGASPPVHRWRRRRRCRSPATACTTRNSPSCSTGCTTARG